MSQQNAAATATAAGLVLARAQVAAGVPIGDAIAAAGDDVVDAIVLYIPPRREGQSIDCTPHRRRIAVWADDVAHDAAAVTAVLDRAITTYRRIADGGNPW